MSEAALPGLPARTPWLAIVLTTVAVLLPAMTYVGPLGFVPLLSVAGGLLLPVWAWRPQARRGILPFAALVLWGLVTYAWSPVAPVPLAELSYGDLEDLVGLKLLLQLPTYATVVVAATCLSGRAAHRFVLVLSIWLALIAALLTIDGAAGVPFYQWLTATFDDPMTPDIAAREVGQGTAAIAVLLWPCALALNRTRARFLIAALLAAAVLAAFILQQQSAVIAVAVGALAFWLVRRFGARAVRVLGAAAVLVVLGAPWLVLGAGRAGLLSAMASALPASWEARIDIWSFAAARIVERPIIGWGLDASRSFPAIPLHPHALSIQLWLELGLVGAGLGALVWWLIFDRVARLAKHDAAAGGAAAAAASAYFLISNLSFGAWQEWWSALGVFAMVLCSALAISRRYARMSEPPHRLRPDGLQPL